MTKTLISNIPRFDLGRFKVVAIASSTGGPGLVNQILSGLPADLSVPILVAQHMPPAFTETFSVRLDQDSPMTVIHAEDGMSVFAGTAYVGRGHAHLRLRKTFSQIQIEVSEEPKELHYKPSGDELFRSCVQIYGSDVLAVVMTGIGRDGTKGAADVREAGGVILTQDESTCAVYGMPRSCAEAGLSDAQLDPDQIRRAILQLSPEHRDKAWS